MARIPFEEVEAWIEARKIRLADAARAFGVSSQTFNGWKSRGQVSADASDAVRSIMAASEESVSAAATPADYVRVQQLDGDAGMGDGRINDDYPEVIRAVDYTRDYIRGMVGFVPPPGRLVLITGRGDSMMPTIMPGDSLLVDTGVSAFDGDGIYLVNLGSGQQIKRLVDHGGAEGIYVHSDNTAVYQPRPLPKEHVIGGKVYLRNRIDRLS